MGGLVNLAGKRILVTGITGFKGNWLATMLYELGAEVYGYGLNPKHRTSLPLNELGQLCTFQSGDIRDRVTFEQFVQEAQPEAIIHMAAQPLVRQAYAQPYETFEINVMGTLTVCETVRKNDHIKALLFVSSDKCYTNREWHWGYRENDHVGGLDPYSASKGCGECINSSYGLSYFKNRTFGSARAGNVIGGGDWSDDRIVPDIMRALEKGTPIVLRNPFAARPWQHVLDVIYGYLLLLERMLSANQSGPFNFGPPIDHVITVSELAQRIIALWGNGTIEHSKKHERYVETEKLHLDSSKAHFELGWNHQVGISDAIDMTIAWYKAYFNGVPIADILSQQTTAYLMSYRHIH